MQNKKLYATSNTNMQIILVNVHKVTKLFLVFLWLLYISASLSRAQMMESDSSINNANGGLMRLFLVHQDKKLSENQGNTFPGYTQDLNSDNQFSVWGGYFLDGDMEGDTYGLYIWALSPWVSNIGQTTTHYRAQIMVNDVVVATKDFSSSSSTITSGTKYTFTGIDPSTNSGDEIKLKISYIGGYGGSISWELGDPSSYIVIPGVQSGIVNIGSVQFPWDNIYDIEIVKDYAYVACNDKTRIIDVSNPTSPIIIGEIPKLTHWFYSLDIVGDYLYCGDSDAIGVFNISDPSNPTLIGSCDTKAYLGWIGEHRGIAISGNYAYVTYRGGLLTIDISNPNNPVIVGNCEGLDICRGVTVKENYAYVAGYWYGLRIINIQNPNNPVLVGTCNTPGVALKVALLGNYAYVADGWGRELQIIDISNPSNPNIVTSFDTQGAVDVNISGNYACVAAGYGRSIQIVNIENLTDPVLAARYFTPGDAVTLSIDGTEIFVGEEDYPNSSYFRIYEFPQLATVVEETFIGANYYKLFQNYPNPFNTSTVIQYQLDMPSQVILKVFDILGKEIITLVNEWQPTGNYSIDFNATGIPSGLYFYKLSTDRNAKTRKMLLLN